MDFVAYLTSKNIDSQKFELNDKPTFQTWEREFAQMNPNSFTSQKLFTINQIRKKHQLHIGAKPKAPKPVEATISQQNVVVDAENKPTKPLFKKPVSTQEGQTPNSDADQQAPKPAFKPVFKKPITASVNTDSPVVDSTNTEEKKTVAKPVFKRPATENKEEENKGVENSEAEPVVAKAPKPVFKRPELKANDSAPNIVASESTEEKPVTEVKKMAKPIFKRPATENKEEENKGVENLEAEPVVAKAPKPVFKRPELKAEDSAPNTVASDSAEEKPVVEVKKMAKPIFKRPASETQDSPKVD